MQRRYRGNDRIWVEVNPSSATRVVKLDGPYTDISGKRYAQDSALAIEPHKSVVLFRFTTAP